MEDVLEEARRVMIHEGRAIIETAKELGVEFIHAVELLDACRKARAMVHLAGIGKSGDVGRKIAATLTSTGTPAIFLHPVEALHGDLGRVRRGDVCVLISRSGQCQETIALADALLRCKAGPTLVAITESEKSDLALRCDVTVRCVSGTEACPHNLAPTSSTAATMALGDALALCLVGLGGFGPDQFLASHPGGALGIA